MYDEKLWAGRGLLRDALVFDGVRMSSGIFLSIYTCFVPKK